VTITTVLTLSSQLELHIGYVYGSTEIPPNASNYVPKYIPGARLPHAWITLRDSIDIDRPPAVDLSYVSELSSDEIALRRYTTLDLCAPDSFTFLISSSPWHLWEKRIQQVKFHYAHSGPKIAVYALGADFDLVPGTRGGGLLVRPDQHIQMRLEVGTSVEDILSSLKGHLGR
jgi:hypothetical protein